MMQSNNITDFHKEEDLTSKQFYASIDKFHKKVKKLQEIILEYCKKRGFTCDKEFFAVHFHNGEVHTMTDNIYQELNNVEAFKEIIEFWFENKDGSEFVDNIYKIEMENKIFLFQLFDFADSNEEGVIAGYRVPNTIDSRLLLLSISNAYIHSQYKTIASFMV